MKKIISMFLVALMAAVSAVSITGCGKVGEKIDETKTQIYVNVKETGVGTTFATNLKLAFEEEYAGKSYETGKKGVQVMITKNDVDKENIEGSLSSDSTDIFYLPNFPIKNLVALASGTSEYLEDVSDIVTEGGAGSIHNRLFDSTRDYFNVGTNDAPKYFALPWFTSYYGTVYDIGLFKEKHLYSTDPQSGLQYGGLNGQVGDEDDNWGPDGKTGTKDNGDGTISDYTLDDGLPATWSDFDQLIGVMKFNDVTPFAFTDFDGYPESWLQALWIDYEGKENYELVKTFNGTYTYKDESGKEQTLTIDETNGYMVAHQNGKKAAISVAKKLISNKWYDDILFDSTTKNKAAQNIFLKSNTPVKYSGTTYPIAFLMEGTWWENEARGTFDDLAGLQGGEKWAYGTREFGLMPFPKFTEGNGFVNASVNLDKITLRSGGVGEEAAAVLINKKSKHKEAAKDFLRFAYSDKMNIAFTVDSGVTKPIQYAMTQEELQNITPFQRNIYQLTQNDNVEIVSGAIRSKYMIKDPTGVSSMVSFDSMIGNSKKSKVLSTFRNANSPTAQEYWNGVLAMNYENTWKTIVGK